VFTSICLLLATALAAYSARLKWRSRHCDGKLNALFEAIDYLILVIDDEGRYVEIGPTNRTALLRPASEMVGRRVHEFFDQEQADFFVDTIRRALRENATVRVDYTIDINGKQTWFNGAVSPIDAKRVVWVATDITDRKLAEEARQQAVVAQVRDIIFTMDGHGTILTLNPAFERITGWPAEEWIGQDFLDLVPRERRRMANGRFAMVLYHDVSPLERLIVRARDGREIVLEVAMVKNVVDGHTELLGSARDITARDRAESALRRSERQLAESQRVAKLGSWEHDIVTDTIWWSDEHFRIYGLPPSPQPLAYETFLSFVPEEEREHLAKMQAMLDARGEHQWELRVRSASGEEKILCCNGKTVRHADGKLLRLVGTVQDITEKKEAERLLRESEERFRLLAQATNDAVWDLDVESGHVWLGNQYETLFGYKPGTIEPSVEAWLALVHPDDRPQVYESYTTAVEAGELSWSSEYRFRRADGSYAMILDRCYIVRDAQKRATRVLGAMMDVTERKQLAEQLAQAKRVSSLGRIAASIAHEFNNVLMGMEPNLELIRRNSTPATAKPVNHVLTSVFRGKRITEEILRFTRAVEPQLQSVALGSLIEEWAAELAPQLGPEIALAIDIQSNDVNVSADPYQIAQILTNLALNARDAMPDGGTCTVTVDRPPSFSTFGFGVVRTPDRFVHIEVKDNGIGMSKEHLAHLFEPLFTTKKHGTGLGLAISYQIVDVHGGMMFAESEPGAGTTFHILLPAMCAAESCEEEPAAVPISVVPLRRVLVVEDEEAVADGIQALFELEGVYVEVAATGGAAIPAIERFDPDAIVLDLGLPDIDGAELYAQIAARWPRMPVLFSSGHADAAKLDQYLKRPMVQLLVKPYSFETLQRTLADLVLSASLSPSAAQAAVPPSTPRRDTYRLQAAVAV